MRGESGDLSDGKGFHKSIFCLIELRREEVRWPGRRDPCWLVHTNPPRQAPNCHWQRAIAISPWSAWPGAVNPERSGGSASHSCADVVVFCLELIWLRLRVASSRSEWCGAALYHITLLEFDAALPSKRPCNLDGVGGVGDRRQIRDNAGHGGKVILFVLAETFPRQQFKLITVDRSQRREGKQPNAQKSNDDWKTPHSRQVTTVCDRRDSDFGTAGRWSSRRSEPRQGSDSRQPPSHVVINNHRCGHLGGHRLPPLGE
jgi:hypothetical protein